MACACWKRPTAGAACSGTPPRAGCPPTRSPTSGSGSIRASGPPTCIGAPNSGARSPTDVSANPEGDKIRQAGRTESDEHKIPEGTFYVTRRHDTSDYYLAFVLSYPSPVHALRGLEEGLITQGQYEAIVEAHRTFREPPQGTRLGGLIEIHGHGTGRRRAWTRGCVALRNVHMDALWEIVEVGTPVIIEP